MLGRYNRAERQSMPNGHNIKACNFIDKILQIQLTYFTINTDSKIIKGVCKPHFHFGAKRVEIQIYFDQLTDKNQDCSSKKIKKIPSATKSNFDQSSMLGCNFLWHFN